MKKVFLLVSLALVLGLVMGCPQPNDGSETRIPLTNEQGQTLMKAVLEKRVVTLTPVYEGETGGLTLKSALYDLVDDSNRANITKITIVPPEGGAKIIPEADLSSLFNDNTLGGLAVTYTSLTTINGLEHLDTSNVTNMGGMFRGCNSLTTLDLSSFDTRLVTSMAFMFSRCDSLPTLDLSIFDTRQVISMEQMFGDCLNLATLDLSSFNTSGVETMDSMFKNVYLTRVTVGSSLTEDIATQITPKSGTVGEIIYADPGKWVPQENLVADGTDTIPVVDGKAVAGTYTAKLAG